MTAELEDVFENKITQPFSEARGALLGSSTPEDRIIWKSGGIRERLETLEAQVASLAAYLSAPAPVVDLDPSPSVVATTFYETASDGALRAGVQVTCSGGDYAMEVALLGDPTVAYADKDATVKAGDPDSNFDSILQVGVPSGGSTERGWIHFEWGTWAASGGSSGLWAIDPLLALVRFTKNGTYNEDDYPLGLYPETFSGGDWGEETITWNGQPEIEGAEIAHWSNRASDSYNWFDITKYMRRVRGTKDNSLEGEPYGFVLCARNETTEAERVSYYTRAGTDDQKPQLWYWTAALKTVILGPALRDAKFYGTPGETYYLAHRPLDANNVPGRWSVPVEVALPSQGDAPSTPAAATKVDTLISHLKTICLTTTVPADFDHYHVYIKETTKPTVTEFNTRVDRFQHWFPFDYSYGGSYEVKYKIVTRSGKESAYSSNLTFSVTSNLKIQSPNGDNWLSLIDSSGLGATVLQMAGNVSDFIVSGDDGDYTVRTDKVKTITHDNILHSCGQASYNSSQNITGTSWTDRTTGSITLTPPGSGNAYYLLIARATVSKGSSTGIRLSFKVDGTQTDDEEAWASADSYETVTIVRRVAVTAGSSHTFKLVAKAADANTAIIGRSNVVALHLGNY